MKIQLAESKECYSLTDTPRVISLYLPLIESEYTPRNRNASGYGSRIATRYMVNLDGRLHRVYCRIFSNIGTCFVEKGGFRFYIDGSA